MGIQINGNTNNINAGIGSLSIEDLREIDIVGVATASNFKTGVSNLHSVGLTLSGGQLDVGSNIKIGTAGVVTATTFSGSGASLTNLPSAQLTGALPALDGSNLTGITQTTISGNANNRIISGSNTANELVGETRLIFDGNTLGISGGGSHPFTIGGGDYRNLAISGNSQSSSGFIYLGNGAATNNADFDLGRIRIYNGATQVAQISGTTDTNANDDGRITLHTKATGGSLTEKLRIESDGDFRLSSNNTTTNYGWIRGWQSSTGDMIISADHSATGTGTSKSNLIFRSRGQERMRITNEGVIYGPSGARKNWFDNGSFDCIGGRRLSTSMDYGNHHAYGWVTDRFQSRNSVQWTRSSNVPAGKGFSYSTQTNGAGGRLVQAVELPDYGDMGVFAPGSYWCVSVWSTAGVNQSGQAFSYDLGSTKTDIPIVYPSSGGVYQSTGETASGTSTGTFTRYYAVFQMPNSIISTATSAYWTWAFTAAGYHTGFQLERVPTATSKPTPYEHVHPSVTTARCRRYAFQIVNSRLVMGYVRHDGSCNWQLQHPVPPTHMPSGSNQSVDPYGTYLHDGGMITNFQSILQNPGLNNANRTEFDYRSGQFILYGSTSWSSTHTYIPSWESQEIEFMHGHF